MINKIRLACAFLAVSLVCHLGCDKGNSNAPAEVSGKVTYNGAPVTGGTITFASTGTSGGAFSGTLLGDGTYIVTDVPIGEMKVSIETESINPNKKSDEYRGQGGGGMTGRVQPKGKGLQMSPKPAGSGGTNPPEYVKIPAKYQSADKSDLKTTIKKGKNVADFTLTD